MAAKLVEEIVVETVGSRVKELRDYLQHRVSCPLAYSEDGECTCSLDKLMYLGEDSELVNTIIAEVDKVVDERVEDAIGEEEKESNNLAYQLDSISFRVNDIDKAMRVELPELIWRAKYDKEMTMDRFIQEIGYIHEEIMVCLGDAYPEMSKKDES